MFARSQTLPRIDPFALNTDVKFVNKGSIAQLEPREQTIRHRAASGWLAVGWQPTGDRQLAHRRLESEIGSPGVKIAKPLQVLRGTISGALCRPLGNALGRNTSKNSSLKILIS